MRPPRRPGARAPGGAAGSARALPAAALPAAALLAAALLAAGCAEERPRAPGAPTGRVHPAGVLDEASADFHGLEVARRGWDLRVCARCHGDDLRGGPAGASCRPCHADGPDSCATCHGDGPTSGAHAAHRPAGALAPAACAECHRVPARWDDPGHVLGDAPPAEVELGARAAITPAPGDRAGTPAWDGARCANVYCHGDALGAAGGTARQPRWEASALPAGCGGCHGAPPPSHASGLDLASCATCHPSAPHVDGALQVGREPGCSGCHGSAASPAPPRDLTGAVITTALGVGAHQAHLAAPARLRGPIPCAECHRVPAALLAPGHLDSPLPAEVTGALGWDRATARCATAWCHGAAAPVWTASEGAACGSCHGAPPATPSHPLPMPLTACAGCHPRTMSAAGAILLTDGPSGPTSEHIDGDVDLL